MVPIANQLFGFDPQLRFDITFLVSRKTKIWNLRKIELSALQNRIRVQEMTLEPNPKSWLAIDIIPLGISLGFIRGALRKKQEGAQIQEAFKLKNVWLSSSELSRRRNCVFSSQFRHVPLEFTGLCQSPSRASRRARSRKMRNRNPKERWSPFRDFIFNLTFRFWTIQSVVGLLKTRGVQNQW